MSAKGGFLEEDLFQQQETRGAFWRGCSLLSQCVNRKQVILDILTRKGIKNVSDFCTPEDSVRARANSSGLRLSSSKISIHGTMHRTLPGFVLAAAFMMARGNSEEVQYLKFR